MSTMEDDTFDYQAWMRETPPDPTKIHRGTAERERRRAAAMLQRAVRIDEDLLKEFRQLATEGQSYEQLINQALREWLFAKGMQGLVRAEIQQAVQQSRSAAQAEVQAPTA
jgi:uncharacterized protein (DUF4415 family)